MDHFGATIARAACAAMVAACALAGTASAAIFVKPVPPPPEPCIAAPPPTPALTTAAPLADAGAADPVEVRFDAVDATFAASVHALSADPATWEALRALLSVPEGAPRPVIDVVSPAVVEQVSPGSNAVIRRRCDDGRTAILLSSATPLNQLARTVAHVLVRASQDAIAGRHLDASWWTESTAEGVAERLVPQGDYRTWSRAIGFIDPGVATLADRDRPPTRRDSASYRAAYLFTRWLERRMGRARFDSRLADAFRAIGRGYETSGTVSRLAGGHFADLFARFWVSRLQPNSPSGPMIRPTVVSVADTVTLRLESGPLSVAVVDLRPAARVRQLTITSPFGSGDFAQLWVVNPGRSAHRWNYGGSASFCLGSGRQSGFARWPGRLVIVYSNNGWGRRRRTLMRLGVSHTPCGTPSAAPASSTGGGAPRLEVEAIPKRVARPVRPSPRAQPRP
jgi:hypothetical protein